LAAGFLEALPALFDAAFGFADRFFVVELFFFGDAEAAFALRRVATTRIAVLWLWGVCHAKGGHY
jgi:hypothetical protein